MAAHMEHVCMGRQKRNEQNKCGGILGLNKRGRCSVLRGLGKDREGFQFNSWLQAIDWKLLVGVEVLE